MYIFSPVIIIHGNIYDIILACIYRYYVVLNAKVFRLGKVGRKIRACLRDRRMGAGRTAGRGQEWEETAGLAGE